MHGATIEILRETTFLSNASPISETALLFWKVYIVLLGRTACR